MAYDSMVVATQPMEVTMPWTEIARVKDRRDGLRDA